MTEDTKKSAPAAKTTAAKKTEAKSEKAASAEKHTLHPGIRAAMVGPSSDDLNPAYAPLKADEE